MRPILLFLLASVLIGCTNYRYDVTDSSGSLKTVRKDASIEWPADPVAFSFKQTEDRVVMLVTNTGKEDLTLEGQRSTIVDPNGQSRALQPQFLPVGAHVKYILPPLRVRYPRGPTWSIGVGTGFRVEAPQAIPEDAHPPVYLDVSTTGDEYWQWDGEGSIRIVLNFVDPHGQSIRRELELRRYKQ